MSRARTTVTISAFVLVLAALLGLGAWQVERLAWKEALIAEIEARRHATPVGIETIKTAQAAGRSVDYTPVTVTGHFDHAHEHYFLATGDNGQPGYFIYTPLVLASGEIVLVNRGFAPDELKDPARRPQGQVDGEIRLTGLARDKLAWKPSWVVPDNDAAHNLFFWKDLSAMSAGLDPSRVLPFFIDANAAPNPGGWPKGGVTQIDLPNNHLSYAVTWFGLAAVLLVVGVLSWRKRR